MSVLACVMSAQCASYIGICWYLITVNRDSVAGEIVAYRAEKGPGFRLLVNACHSYHLACCHLGG